MRYRYELIMWFQHFCKCIPGKIGCHIRNFLLPYVSGSNSFIWDGTHIDSPAKLKIGDNVSINRGCVINAAGGVTIFNDVLVGPGVVIYSQNHNYDDINQKINKQGYNLSPVLIRENVWIGARVIILPGVKIGSNSIIGAGSVVTKNVESNVVVAGNPAKEIKNLR